MMSLSYADVGEILKMIDSSSCAEVVLELDGIKMIVRRGEQGSSVPEISAISDSGRSDFGQSDFGQSDFGQSDFGTPTGNAVASRIPPPSANKPDAGRAAAGGGDIVKSPMVGTFYSKPSPEDPPFVAVGQNVKKGDTLCLIEVMKLFTTVECTADGTVETIFAEDGALVEFDQPLFLIA
ncbi:acetyl-CoA carboxylase biotin carboxyl carrier protein [Alphaproteobacteria bacterium]|nr:acetyl-CoA carboxylase biotin carboxyl carrier protein [Alphaproteobacteria bacterium]